MASAQPGRPAGLTGQSRHIGRGKRTGGLDGPLSALRELVKICRAYGGTIPAMSYANGQRTYFRDKNAKEDHDMTRILYPSPMRRLPRITGKSRESMDRASLT